MINQEVEDFHRISEERIDDENREFVDNCIIIMILTTYNPRTDLEVILKNA